MYIVDVYMYLSCRFCACTIWSNHNKMLHALTYHPSEETSDANNLYQKYSRHYEDVLKREQKKYTAYVIALFLFGWFVARTTLHQIHKVDHAC